MKLVLVGNRNGKAVINWPGVFASFLITSTLAIAGAAALMIVFNWFSLPGLLIPGILGAACIIGFGVRRALNQSKKELEPLT